MYKEGLKGVVGISFLEDIEGVRHNYSYFPIFVDTEKYGMTRDELYEKLKSHNIMGRRYFYPLISDFPTYSGLESAVASNLPNSHKIANSVICLPLYDGLCESEINMIISCI